MLFALGAQKFNQINLATLLMKTSFKDQYENWCTMITLIASQCVCAADFAVTVSRQKLVRKGAINCLRFSDLT